MEASAKNCLNVEEAFIDLAKQVQEQYAASTKAKK
jgi:hypothetical protein